MPIKTRLDHQPYHRFDRYDFGHECAGKQPARHPCYKQPAADTPVIGLMSPLGRLALSSAQAARVVMPNHVRLEANPVRVDSLEEHRRRDRRRYRIDHRG